SINICNIRGEDNFLIYVFDNAIRYVKYLRHYSIFFFLTIVDHSISIFDNKNVFVSSNKLKEKSIILHDFFILIYNCVNLILDDNVINYGGLTCTTYGNKQKNMFIRIKIRIILIF